MSIEHIVMETPKFIFTGRTRVRVGGKEKLTV
jgi:hypothetical protein